jgi:phage repressor protein C with HTH and peptisase S24 domain
MPPYNNGSYIIGKYVEKKNDLRSGKTYIFITEDGIIYKRYQKESGVNGVLRSDNTFYKPFEIDWKNVLEVWEFKGSINTTELEIEKSEHFEIKNMFEILRNEIQSIKNQ